MSKRYLKALVAFCLLVFGPFFGLVSCTKSAPTLKVAASSVPHAMMLDAIKSDLAAEGIQLEIVVVDDFNLPNRALADKEVDANFFQHLPFLQAQIKGFHYPIEAYAKIHIEPLGLYSQTVKNLADLPDKAVIAVPNDPTNEARALQLLAHAGLITLDTTKDDNLTILNIVTSAKSLRIEEIDAAMLPRALHEVDAAVINTNFALQAALNPLKDALLLEDSQSEYVNILAIRQGEENRPELRALKKAMTSEKMRLFIEKNYQGAIIAVF